ncbi:hypothetical protein CSPX01_17373 [Colletotrichum filicis]|nr:hypothetical protein CSPX01_17373 [Colletotrichum filicis]
MFSSCEVPVPLQAAPSTSALRRAGEQRTIGIIIIIIIIIIVHRREDGLDEAQTTLTEFPFIAVYGGETVPLAQPSGLLSNLVFPTPRFVSLHRLAESMPPERVLASLAQSPELVPDATADCLVLGCSG